jgi:hypothetical protein
LEKLPNGKYVQGVQGYRYGYKNALKHAKAARIAGKTVGVLGLTATSADMYVNGINLSNSLDMTFGVVGFLPGAGWIVSLSYFVVNTTVEWSTGKDIGEHITDFVK